jgi:hypothetical protein
MDSPKSLVRKSRILGVATEKGVDGHKGNKSGTYFEVSKELGNYYNCGCLAESENNL